jgi:hypothetical protein
MQACSHLRLSPATDTPEYDTIRPVPPGYTQIRGEGGKLLSHQSINRPKGVRFPRRMNWVFVACTRRW